jgi:hypothetical protein
MIKKDKGTMPQDQAEVQTVMGTMKKKRWATARYVHVAVEVARLC